MIKPNYSNLSPQFPANVSLCLRAPFIALLAWPPSSTVCKLGLSRDERLAPLPPPRPPPSLHPPTHPHYNCFVVTRQMELKQMLVKSETSAGRGEKKEKEERKTWTNLVRPDKTLDHSHSSIGAIKFARRNFLSWKTAAAALKRVNKKRPNCSL